MTRLFLLGFIVLIHLNASSKDQAGITYVVSMEEPQTHYFHVEMRIEGIEEAQVDIKMATWTPGSYLIREFARNVESFGARSGKGKKLDSRKINKNTWRVKSNKEREFSVRYDVYAFEHTVRTSFLDDTHASIIGASVFMYVEGYDLPVTIRIEPYKKWKEISTGLKPLGSNKWVLSAPNKDILFDSPIEIGNHRILKFEAAGIPHYMALYGEGNYKEDKLREDAAKVIEECTNIFGGNPCEDYTFIIHNTEKNYGGLEHLNSTSLIYRRWGYDPPADYRGFLGLLSHEYFHLWNVKRIRPESLGPFDYENENYTTALWVVEGFTSYYDDLVLRRADLMTVNEYLNIVQSTIATIENAPGNNVQPVAHASFDAWIKFYRRNENSGNCCVSYYSKGAVVAMMLDLEILNNSKGKKRLDDVMKNLYQQYLKNPDKGYTEEEFQKTVEKVAGKSLDRFFDDYVYGTELIDYQYYFDHVGLDVKNENEGINEVLVGVGVGADNKITHVRRNSSAWDAGLNARDEIVAIDGYRFKNNLKDVIDDKKVGEHILVLVDRDGVMREIDVELKASEVVKYKLVVQSDPSELQKDLYKIWLHTDSYY